MNSITRMLPFVFASVGAGTGVGVAMLYHADPTERARVHLHVGLPSAVFGMAGGGMAGSWR